MPTKTAKKPGSAKRDSKAKHDSAPPEAPSASSANNPHAAEELKIKRLATVVVPIVTVLAGSPLIMKCADRGPALQFGCSSSAPQQVRMSMSAIVDRIAKKAYSEGVIRHSVSLHQLANTLRPTNDVYTNGVGAALLNDGQHKKAEQKFRDAMAIDATNAKARYNLALALAFQGRCSEAEEALAAATTLRPDYSQRTTVTHRVQQKCR